MICCDDDDDYTFVCYLNSSLTLSCDPIALMMFELQLYSLQHYRRARGFVVYWLSYTTRYISRVSTRL